MGALYPLNRKGFEFRVDGVQDAITIGYDLIELEGYELKLTFKMMGDVIVLAGLI